MKTRKHDTHKMVGVAVMSAVIMLLASTPLGLIPLGVIKATTVHIPVIVGAILYGPWAGGLLGAVFGICSMISSTVAPGPTAFVFSPFMSTTGLSGALKAIWISVGCRICIGVAAGWLWRGLKKCRTPDFVALPIVGFAGSMVNTVMVMGSIYFLLAEEYAAVQNVALSALYALIMGTVTGAGVMEALAAMVLVTALGKAMLQLARRLRVK